MLFFYVSHFLFLLSCICKDFYGSIVVVIVDFYVRMCLWDNISLYVQKYHNYCCFVADEENKNTWPRGIHTFTAILNVCRTTVGM